MVVNEGWSKEVMASAKDPVSPMLIIVKYTDRKIIKRSRKRVIFPLDIENT